MTMVTPGRLPPIAETAEEAAATELVADLMRETTRNLAATPSRIVMRGATAARIGHGLPRPSTDIDIDVVGDFDPWTAIGEAARSAGLTAVIEPDRRRRLKGAMRIAHPHIGAIRVEVDIRPVRDEVLAQQIRDGTHTERKHGVLMYRAEELVHQKFAMARLPKDRLRAKDRYDIAWWLTEHVEAVTPPLRANLDEALHRNPQIHEHWDRQHRTATDLPNVSPETVREVLDGALDHDPAVLERRSPNGTLTVDLDTGPSTTLTWCRNDGTGHETELARFADDRELETFMVRFGVWTREETGRQLATLANERKLAGEHPATGSAPSRRTAARSGTKQPDGAGW